MDSSFGEIIEAREFSPGWSTAGFTNKFGDENNQLTKFRIESLESTSDDGNTGTPSFRDIDDTRDGFQVVVNLDYSAFGLAENTFDGYVKYVSIEDFVAYQEWHASLTGGLKI